MIGIVRIAVAVAVAVLTASSGCSGAASGAARAREVATADSSSAARSLWADTLAGVRLDSVAAADSAAAARDSAAQPPVAEARRIVVSLERRRLWWIDGEDTLLTTPIAVGKSERLRFGKRVWAFDTPTGYRRVIAKGRDPVWTPPEWHYAELARDSSLALVHLRRGRDVPLGDGSVMEVRGDRVGRAMPDGTWEEMPPDEEVVFGDTLFVPPEGTVNRRVEGELGRYKLELGDGYMIHGTRDSASIGRAATHGCIRVPAKGLAYLYRHVPVGAQVYIY
ncbi:MAG TPA: L,D-transpeptidase [Longimicrobiaceae bacterium]|nr:L,D-transpeptidase [Longimicrobiaceae bacterium]